MITPLEVHKRLAVSVSMKAKPPIGSVFSIAKPLGKLLTGLARIILQVIRLYQNFISPHFGKICRFYPSCSRYCGQAIEKYGLAKGLWLGIKRIFKCHPWNLGGIDLP